MFGIGIIGCGLIGKKRANSLGNEGRLVACADINLKNAKRLAKDFNAIATDSWEEILKIDDIDDMEQLYNEINISKKLNIKIDIKKGLVEI